MLRPIHSIPDSCPDCGSENLGGRAVLMREEGNTIVCNHCGIVMVLQDEWSGDDDEEDRIRGRCSGSEACASFIVCPHCETPNAIYASGGEEWCGECGLNPNCEEYQPEDIAHLWKPDSAIRKALERGKPKPGGRMFEFVSKFCGPHCSFAENCPQASKNFSTCYREEFHSPDEVEVVGKKHKKSKSERRKEKRERKKLLKAQKRAEKKAAQKEVVAVLECASSGWYERNLKHRNETPNPQESTHTGSGSGT